MFSLSYVMLVLVLITVGFLVGNFVKMYLGLVWWNFHALVHISIELYQCTISLSFQVCFFLITYV